MSVFVIGGTGFIGLRVIRLLAARGEEVVCMDINPHATSFADLGAQVRVIRGDVTQFDEISSIAHLSYNSFQTKYEKRYGNGLALKGSFTWSNG